MESSQGSHKDKRNDNPEDAPGYTDKKLSDRLYVSSLFTPYKEKSVLQVLRPFQTYWIFEDRASECWIVVGIRDLSSYLVIKQEHVIVECQSDRTDYNELPLGSVLHFDCMAILEQTFPVGPRTAGIGPI